MIDQALLSDALRVTDLEAGYREANVLHGVNLKVRQGQIVAVIGPNGCGKSTLIKAIYGLIPARRGQILFNGSGLPRSLVGLHPYEITRLGINYVPQRRNVFEEMSILENLEISYLPRGKAQPTTFDAVFEIFPMLQPRRRERAGVLSGGQRQMLALARALVTEPDLLILDEPSAGLAPKIVAELFERIVAINRRGTSILIVEQNARRVLEIASHAYVLELGRNRYEGAGLELLANPEIVEVFVGTRRRPS